MYAVATGGVEPVPEEYPDTLCRLCHLLLMPVVATGSVEPEPEPPRTLCRLCHLLWMPVDATGEWRQTAVSRFCMPVKHFADDLLLGV